MTNIHRPAMLVLLETKMVEHKSLTNALGFDIYIQASVVGLSGGIVFMWKDDILHLENLFTSA